MPETSSKYGAAQPIADVVEGAVAKAKKLLGYKDAPVAPSPKPALQQSSGTLPSAWEQANKTSIEQAKAARQAKTKAKYK